MNMTTQVIEQLFHHHRHELTRAIRRIVRCEQVAADLAQETYMRFLNMGRSVSVSFPRARSFEPRRTWPSTIFEEESLNHREVVRLTYSRIYPPAPHLPNECCRTSNGFDSCSTRSNHCRHDARKRFCCIAFTSVPIAKSPAGCRFRKAQ